MKVDRLACPDCENSVDLLYRDGPLRCGDCDTELEWFGTAGVVQSLTDDAVARDELRELIEKWRTDRSGFARSPGIRECADDLEAVLEGDDGNE